MKSVILECSRADASPLRQPVKVPKELLGTFAPHNQNIKWHTEQRWPPVPSWAIGRGLAHWPNSISTGVLQAWEDREEAFQGRRRTGSSRCCGRRAGDRARSQHLCWIQLVFLGSPWQSQTTWTSHLRLCSIWGCASHLWLYRDFYCITWGKFAPCPGLVQQQPQPCTGFSTSKQACRFQHKLRLHCTLFWSRKP